MQALVVAALFLNAVLQSSGLSIAPFVFYLAFVGLQYPRPSWRLWDALLIYLSTVWNLLFRPLK